MGRPKKDTTVQAKTAAPPLNSDARKHTILNAGRELDRLDGEIAELQKERAKIKNTLVKGDLGMKVAYFNVVRRFAALEAEARDQLFDTLREGFKALGIGTQSSFLGAMEKTPKAKKEKTVAKAPEPEELAGDDHEDPDDHLEEADDDRVEGHEDVDSVLA